MAYWPATLHYCMQDKDLLAYRPPGKAYWPPTLQDKDLLAYRPLQLFTEHRN